MENETFAVTENPVLSAGSFFVLQLGWTLLLERRSRRLRGQMGFPETRKGLAALRAGLQERFEHETD